MEIKLEYSKDWNLGDLVFPLPKKEEIKKAMNVLSEICKNNLDKLYGKTFSPDRLNQELQRIEKAGTAFYYLILKEIVDLSKKMGYPVLYRTVFENAFVLYLLGITSINPMKPHYNCPACECKTNCDGWHIPNMYSNYTSCDCDYLFEIDVATSVAKEIQGYLNGKFYGIKGSKRLFCRIHIMDSDLCEKSKKAYLKRSLDKKIDLSKVWYDRYSNLPKPETVTMEYLLRAEGFIHASFEDKNNELFQNKKNPVFRETLYEILNPYDFSAEELFFLVRKGYWEPHKLKSEEMLKEHGVPQEIISIYNKLLYLQPKSFCAEALWFFLNYEFDEKM